MDSFSVVADGYNIAPIAGSRKGCIGSYNLTDEAKIEKSVKQGEAMRKKWASKKGEILNNSNSEKWYEDGGMGDLWLRNNDPDYGDRKRVDYLTARQYRYRAKEREIPCDPSLMERDY